MIFKIKQWLFWLAYRIDQWVPQGVGIWLRNRCWPWRPVLDAVELHLADRCNMNCTGCSHFSPFAEEWFADAEVVLADLRLLKDKFSGGIRHINLLGGEPLLHAGLCDIIVRIHALSPSSLITVVTNGILLARPSELTERFLSACRAAGARVKWTLYPPMQSHRKALVKMFAEAGVSLRVEEADTFWARMVPEGTVNPRRAFHFCRQTTYCPYLREGRLYPCAQAFHIRDFARVQPLQGALTLLDLVQHPERMGLDLHDAALTPTAILRFLMSPGPVCRYCADSYRIMSWSQGSRDVKDWRR